MGVKVVQARGCDLHLRRLALKKECSSSTSGGVSWCWDLAQLWVSVTRRADPIAHAYPAQDAAQTARTVMCSHALPAMGSTMIARNPVLMPVVADVC